MFGSDVFIFMLLFLLMALIVIGLVAIVQWLDRSTKRKRLSRLQERTRLGQCRRCGYDLTGLGGGGGGTVLRTVIENDRGRGEGEDTARRAVPPVCPECGAEDD